MRSRLPFLFALLIALAPAAWAATISGRVIVDYDGSAVPGATVVLSGPALQGVRTTTTDGQGRYWFAGLPAGSDYRLAAELSGFSPWPMTVEYLFADEHITAELTMDIGIRECNLGRQWQIVRPAPASAAFHLRIR